MVQDVQVSINLIYHHIQKNMTYQILRIDDKFIKLHGKRKTFFKGGNSTCRLHICQHYKLYKERCEKEKIPLHHWAIPRPI